MLLISMSALKVFLLLLSLNSFIEVELARDKPHIFKVEFHVFGFVYTPIKPSPQTNQQSPAFPEASMCSFEVHDANSYPQHLAQGMIELLSVTKYLLTFLKILYEWNHTEYTLLGEGSGFFDSA